VILVWGLPADEPVASVVRQLEARHAPFILVDQRAVLETTVSLVVDDGLTGCVHGPTWSIDLVDVGAAYLRPYDAVVLPSVRQAGTATAEAHAVAVEEALLAWSDLAPGLVVNRPAAMATNNSKPYQADLIRRFGFDVPPTLVTTDPVAARAFWERHGHVIYKSVSGVRSVVSRLGPRHVERLDAIGACPTQLQAYIAGIDYRVHVVGDELFACEILSDADDYRYAPHSVRACELPVGIADNCRALAAGLGLTVAGIDLRRTPRDLWMCFEVNPSPGYTFYQNACGLAIDAAIARLLAVSDARGPAAESTDLKINF
jgi:hypothetical protein